MNQLLAHIKFVDGDWIVSFSRGGAGCEDRFSHSEISNLARFWQWLASLSARQTPERKWTQAMQTVELASSGSWYHGMDCVA